MKNRILLFAVIGLTGLAVFLNWYLDNKTGQGFETASQSKIKKELVKEFNNSYPEKADTSGEVKEFDIVAAPSEAELYDNVTTEVWAYNGTVPGPQLRVRLGDTLKVNFTNNLPQETTVHFHGVRVPNAMDGVPGVTQDPIQPGETFVYEFTPKDAGTFWFHPHVRSSEQVERGLYGTLIVEDKNPQQFTKDITWVLDDWRLLENGEIDSRFNTGHDLSHDGRWGNTITVNGKTNFESTLQPGDRVRLRLLNSSNGRVYQLYFGGIDAQVIAYDGMTVAKTFDANYLTLSPGNRADIDLVIPKDSSGDIFSITDQFTRNTNTLATISVVGDEVTTPNFPTTTAETFPDWSAATSLLPDKEYRLNARRGGEYGIEWTINDKAFPDYDPISLKAETFNKIRFTNESARLHPMHLHGQFFKVLARNGQPVDEPYWRDTVLISSKETVDIGLVPIDKGKWVNHCHILEHAEAGMMTVVEVT